MSACLITKSADVNPKKRATVDIRNVHGYSSQFADTADQVSGGTITDPTVVRVREIRSGHMTKTRSFLKLTEKRGGWKSARNDILLPGGEIVALQDLLRIYQYQEIDKQ